MSHFRLPLHKTTCSFIKVKVKMARAKGSFFLNISDLVVITAVAPLNDILRLASGIE